MAIDDDPLIIKARYVVDDVDPKNETIAKTACNVIANAALPLHLGEVITGLLGSVSQRRWNERVAELLQDFATRVVEFSESIPDHHYYESEEFQALIIEAIDQQRTNRFVLKRKMLAAGLARSGTAKYRSVENKELLIQLMRAVEIYDLSILINFTSHSRWDADGSLFSSVPFHSERLRGDQKDRCRRLVGLGLMTSRLHAGGFELNSLFTTRRPDLHDLIEALPKAKICESFHISPLGDQLLAFLNAENPNDKDPPVSE